MSLELPAQTRLVIDARLRPVIGSGFQPTGFANLGAAEFTRPGGRPALLVESVQSMANHLEGLGIDAGTRGPIGILSTVPWVAVRDPDGALLTSSRLEPHRLASVYVREASIDEIAGVEWLVERLSLRPKKPLDMRAIYQAIFQIDPLCLIHGVFFSDKKFSGNPKVRRAVTALIEAHGVTPLVSGGLKRDDVQFTASAGAGAEEGYGFVPFGRTEYVAEDIVLSAAIDLHQIRGYGLGAAESRLLELLAIWEVAALLDGPLRLRTACDLEVEKIDVRRPGGFELPVVADLEAAIAAALADVTFEVSGERTATWSPKA